MIDTIVLSLDRGYSITRYDAFSPCARDLYEYPYRSWGKEGYLKSIQNPPKQDTQYKPRLTIVKRRVLGSYPTLKIELSLPKLLYGNNFVELENSNFSLILDFLQARLKDMGVSVSLESLSNSRILAVHYSKNFIIEQGFTCAMVLREIHKSQINAKLDDCVTKFRNEGHSLTFHSNSYEVVFYDKVKDIEQAKISPKRAIDRDGLGLFQDNFSYLRQVLRMEVRLNKPQKIRSILEKTGCSRNLIFKELFSSDISKKVLAYYWDILRSKMSLGLNPLKCSAEQLFLATTQRKPTQILAQVGFYMLQDELGIKGLRSLLASYSDSRTATRITKKYSFGFIPKNIYLLINKISKDIEDYNPLTQKEYVSIFGK